MKKFLIIGSIFLILTALVVNLTLPNIKFVKAQNDENEENEEHDPEDVCKARGLKGLEFRRCIIEEKFGKKLQKTFEKSAKEFADSFKEEIELFTKDLKEKIHRRAEIFFIGPAGQAIAKGDVKEISSSTLTLDVHGFAVIWDISRAKVFGEENSTTTSIAVGENVFVKGAMENNRLVAERILREMIKVEKQEKETKAHEGLPAPVPVLLKQIIEALRAKGIEINIPQQR